MQDKYQDLVIYLQKPLWSLDSEVDWRRFFIEFIKDFKKSLIDEVAEDTDIPDEDTKLFDDDKARRKIKPAISRHFWA